MRRHSSLTIGQLAEACGIAPATLRMWESRHGFPEPQRLDSGHRRYGEQDVERRAPGARPPRRRRPPRAGDRAGPLPPRPRRRPRHALGLRRAAPPPPAPAAAAAEEVDAAGAVLGHRGRVLRPGRAPAHLRLVPAHHLLRPRRRPLGGAVAGLPLDVRVRRLRRDRDPGRHHPGRARRVRPDAPGVVGDLRRPRPLRRPDRLGAARAGQGPRRPPPLREHLDRRPPSRARRRAHQRRGGPRARRRRGRPAALRDGRHARRWRWPTSSRSRPCSPASWATSTGTADDRPHRRHHRLRRLPPRPRAAARRPRGPRRHPQPRCARRLLVVRPGHPRGPRRQRPRRLPRRPSRGSTPSSTSSTGCPATTSATRTGRPRRTWPTRSPPQGWDASSTSPGSCPTSHEDELSEHIVSRLEVERVLTDTPATTVTLRAAVLVGRRLHVVRDRPADQ